MDGWLAALPTAGCTILVARAVSRSNILVDAQSFSGVADNCADDGLVFAFLRMFSPSQKPTPTPLITLAP